MIANENANISAKPPIASGTLEWIRQPMRRPDSDINVIGSVARSRLATAWPDSSAPRGIGNERKRSTAPFFRSLARATAVPHLDRAAEDVREQDREHDRLDRRVSERLGLTTHVGEPAPRDHPCAVG